MKVYYRISDVSQSNAVKVKPAYISNEKCLLNFLTNFLSTEDEMVIIADNVGEETKQFLEKIRKEWIDINYQIIDIVYLNIGHGAGTFKYCLDEVRATTTKDNMNEIIYFVENDYIHCEDSREMLIEGINLGANYVTLYDHPDKYINKENGGNPYVEGGGELTKVFVSNSCHWKLTNSTTMTLAATRSTLLFDYFTINKYVSNTYPNDFQMFIELTQSVGRVLISSIPAYSTHGETAWLSPHRNWKSIIEYSQNYGKN